MSGQVCAVDAVSPHPRLKGIEHIEIFVGHIRQAAHYYRMVWGFQPVASRGLDTSSQDRVSIAMRHGNSSITLLLTGAIESSAAAAAHLQLHGEGVARVSFAVSDSQAAFQTAVARWGKIRERARNTAC